MTEADSTLEAVARGIKAEIARQGHAAGDYVYDDVIDYDDQTDTDIPRPLCIGFDGRLDCGQITLAAIKALAEREPSAEAIDAARKMQWDLTGCQFIRDDFVALYRAMLSQLVKEAQASAGKEMGDE